VVTARVRFVNVTIDVDQGVIENRGAGFLLATVDIVERCIHLVVLTSEPVREPFPLAGRTFTTK
jgi:hypothetical protein